MWMSAKAGNERKHMDDDEVDMATAHLNHNKILTYWKTTLSASALVVFTIALTIYIALRPSRLSPPQLSQLLQHPCGRTPNQARAANCSFDVMMDEWLPETCLDRELLDEFKALKTWLFWADENRTEPISEAQLSEKSVAYTTMEYHVAHCSFALRKFHRAIASGRVIEQAVARVAHTTHCAEMHRTLIESLEDYASGNGGQHSPMEVVTPLHPGFPICVDTKDFEMFQ